MVGFCVSLLWNGKTAMDRPNAAVQEGATELRVGDVSNVARGTSCGTLRYVSLRVAHYGVVRHDVAHCGIVRHDVTHGRIVRHDVAHCRIVRDDVAHCSSVTHDVSGCRQIYVHV